MWTVTYLQHSHKHHSAQWQSTPPAKIISHSNFQFGLSAAELIRFPSPIRFAPRIGQHRKLLSYNQFDAAAGSNEALSRATRAGRRFGGCAARVAGDMRMVEAETRKAEQAARSRSADAGHLPGKIRRSYL